LSKPTDWGTVSKEVRKKRKKKKTQGEKAGGWAGGGRGGCGAQQSPIRKGKGIAAKASNC